MHKNKVTFGPLCYCYIRFTRGNAGRRVVAAEGDEGCPDGQGVHKGAQQGSADGSLGNEKYAKQMCLSVQYQLMCMVLFFKGSRYSLEQILGIVTVTESINGNDWNSWDTAEEAEYFYHHIYGISIEELDNLETEFGDITFPVYDSGLKVPLGTMKPNELKLYLYLLRHGKGRKKDITSLHISANKLDRIMDSAILIKKDGLIYSIMDKKVKNYIYLSEEELDAYLQWDENEAAVYLYLKFRYGDDGSIQTSRESIEKGTCMTHTVVTRTIQHMEDRKLIAVTRKGNQHHLAKELRESNTYILLGQPS